MDKSRLRVPAADGHVQGRHANSALSRSDMLHPPPGASTSPKLPPSAASLPASGCRLCPRPISGQRRRIGNPAQHILRHWQVVPGLRRDHKLVSRLGLQTIFPHEAPYRFGTASILAFFAHVRRHFPVAVHPRERNSGVYERCCFDIAVLQSSDGHFTTPPVSANR